MGTQQEPFRFESSEPLELDLGTASPTLAATDVEAEAEAAAEEEAEAEAEAGAGAGAGAGAEAPGPDHNATTAVLLPPPEAWYLTEADALHNVTSWAERHKYRIVRARSSKSSDGVAKLIYLMCDRSRSTVSKATGIRKRQPSRRIGCPFSLAVGYRKNHQLWYVRIRNPNHNHGPSEPRKPARKQKKELPPPISAPVPAIGAQSLLAQPAQSAQASTQQSAPPPERLMIPGLRDVALRAYCEWQESYVQDAVLKVEFRKARDVAHANGFDLEQIYFDNDPQFFIENGVKKGIARRFVTDIKQWAKLCEELN